MTCFLFKLASYLGKLILLSFLFAWGYLGYLYFNDKEIEAIIYLLAFVPFLYITLFFGSNALALLLRGFAPAMLIEFLSIIIMFAIVPWIVFDNFYLDKNLSLYTIIVLVLYQTLIVFSEDCDNALKENIDYVNVD